ncbi:MULTISPECIES: pyridoxal-phosphate dependent enzyme [unclassified Nocardioides]|uniref:pyridoxal-phosphate dependent enzyme n=1 Tax=unclassified Nocardioides TaxID=2615069 RepID=UPI0000574D1F|nr:MULTISPECIES: pyridoxal-phosphate dependent enzyme [unclassified Nocardioides]ABL81140.1 Pyridoxal-5'-phosphate-dependent enzyme, beta subunit [Nocardioides sp. JS614]
MSSLGVEGHVVDAGSRDRAVAHFRAAGIVLPTLAELADPSRIPVSTTGALRAVGPDEADPRNLFRIHWYNDASRVARTSVPEHVVLPRELTGVDARIAVVFGDRFPMIRAHKVLAAYACLVPRIVTGGFDPTSQRAVWPSTGNYCRGGVAISRILGCRGVAVLPAGMSQERFDWLREWVVSPEDVVTTPGTESNVREIYEACDELARDPGNVILNQFSEFGNHLAHWLCTGRALGDVFEHLRETDPDAGADLRLRAFVSASGSAGTLGAGDHLKEAYGAVIVAAEALECPTMLRNGFGEHNIQGIGDKHIPLIHHVHNTDVVVDVTDRATDQLSVLFSDPEGLAYLARRRGVPDATLAALPSLGLSSICNVLAAIKTAKHLELGPDDVIVTVATDGAQMYESERRRIRARDFAGGFDEETAAEVFGRWMLGADDSDLLETTTRDRERIFDLGYYTWVEQRGIPIEDFVARRVPAFWSGLRTRIDSWDELIADFNARTGLAGAGSGAA